MDRNMREQFELISQQIKELVGVYQEAVFGLGISENEFWIWYTLINMKGDYSQQDICKIWSLSKQTVNTIVSHMAQRGYVRLEVVPGTRNRKNILLTESGKSYGESIVEPITRAEQRALNKLPIEDQIACTNALNKYIKFLREEIHGEQT